MRIRLLPFAALAALAFSTSGHAAKPSPPTCRPTLPAPTGLAVVSDGTTITSTWNEVESVLNEATKYGLEITAHYADYADVTFAFTAFDDDAGVLNTASFAIAASGLATTVCDDVECTTSTTHNAESVIVKVKGLLPPKKGKGNSQCNPFSEPVLAEVAETCPCFDATFLQQVADSTEDGRYYLCRANQNLGFGPKWTASAFGPPFATASDATSSGDSKQCFRAEADANTFSASNLTDGQFSACTMLIEAAQQTVGCVSCVGDNCP